MAKRNEAESKVMDGQHTMPVEPAFPASESAANIMEGLGDWGDFSGITISRKDMGKEAPLSDDELLGKEFPDIMVFVPPDE